MGKLGILAAAILVLSGCANGYSQFYQPSPGVTAELIAERRAGPPPVLPTVEKIAPGDPQEILAAYAKRGMDLIGYSSFNSGRSESESSALNHGKVVGADTVVIINPQYTGTVSSVIPLTTPTSTTSYTNSSATAYGAAGTVNAYGSSTTTTYGTKTTYIPMSTDRYDYTALYLIKTKTSFGVYTRELNDDERQRFETNRGAIIRIVIDGSPAYMADVLPGDLLLQIGDRPINSPNDVGPAVAERKGRATEVRLNRAGRELTKTIEFK